MKNPDWLKDAIFYQIYPQSFYDSNKDGIGDIPGIIQKLDYIKSTGCNAIWLNPCFVSPFKDAGYDIADYYKVDPRYGTNADLKRLFRTAKSKGLRVLLDLVPGHTSIDCPWFAESCKAERNKYSDWYIWTDSIWNNTGGKLNAIGGYAERDAQYITNFFYIQPALNFGFAKPDPKCRWQQPVDAPGPKMVRNEMKKIMRFWLDMGADGFRVDMAPSLVKFDHNGKIVSEFWRDVRKMLDREYPDAAIVSEWGDPPKALKAGFHMDFLLHFGVSPKGYLPLFRRQEKSFFSRHSKGNIMEFLNYYMGVYRATKKDGYICIPSGNHDMSRLNDNFTKRELEIILVFLFTMPGVPFFYYGDEIGMKYLGKTPSKEGGYGRTGSRTPMQWSSAKNAGFSSAPSSKLYLPIDKDKNRPTVEKQENDPDSLLNEFRTLAKLRKSNAALQADGEFILLHAKEKSYPFIYMRKNSGKTFVIALNPSKYELNVPLNGRKINGSLREKLVSKTSLVTKSNVYELQMQPQSYAIYEVI
ncbi:MAG: alpha-amylase family glycosyl hydrolase [Elusimicrobiota bacterium]